MRRGVREERVRSYLLVRIAQLVLQNGVAIDQRLNLVGKCMERPSQSLGKAYVVHPIDAVERAGGARF